MSIECIQHIENSWILNQKLAIEQKKLGNTESAISFYLEALYRIEILCTSYEAHLKIGPSLCLHYIEISLSLADLYKLDDKQNKYQPLLNKIKRLLYRLDNPLLNGAHLPAVGIHSEIK